MDSRIAGFLLVLLPVLVAHSQPESEPAASDVDAGWEEWQTEFEALDRELEMWLDAEPTDPGALYSLSLEAGLGYRDNIRLSSVNRSGSAFLHTGADFFWWSGARPDEREVSFFLFGTNRSFLRSGASDERTAALNVRGTLETAPGWSVQLPLDLMLFDQVTDVSTREVQLDAVRVRGGRIRFEPGAGFQATERSVWQGRAIGRYSFFSAPLDDHRELGAGLSWKYDYDRNTDLGFDLTAVHRRYASREALEADGEPVPGRRLEFVIPRFEAFFDHYWDPEQRWRSRTSVGGESNRDNGGGYFDFWRPFVSQRITYRHFPWEGEVFAGVSRYSYTRRTANANNTGPNLKRNTVDFGVRGVYSLNYRYAAFASFNHERIDTNERDGGYRMNTILTGLEATF